MQRRGGALQRVRETCREEGRWPAEDDGAEDGGSLAGAGSGVRDVPEGDPITKCRGDKHLKARQTETYTRRSL